MPLSQSPRFAQSRYYLRSAPPCGTFHCRQGQGSLPFELTCMILEYAESGNTIFGRRGLQHPPVAYVSKALREAYFRLRSTFAFDIPRNLPPPSPQPKVGEVLSFPDFLTMAQFFTTGPGQVGPHDGMSRVKFMRVFHTDREGVAPRWYESYCTVDQYVFEVFDILAKSQSRMSLKQVQLVMPWYSEVFGIDSPGIWGLLKLRGLEKFYLKAPRFKIPKRLTQVISKRVQWPPTRLWQPIGTENPGPGDWEAAVRVREGQDLVQAQFAHLEQRYRYLHDRSTVVARRQHRRRWRDRSHGISVAGKRRRREKARIMRRRRISAW
jgi:hypothetical protein